jgi:hypothetical protein
MTSTKKNKKKMQHRRHKNPIISDCLSTYIWVKWHQMLHFSLQPKRHKKKIISQYTIREPHALHIRYMCFQTWREGSNTSLKLTYAIISNFLTFFPLILAISHSSINEIHKANLQRPELCHLTYILCKSIL